MGEVDAADPTELAPTENETASVRAWGLDAVDYDDYDEPPTTRLTPGRITGGAVAASLVAVAVAAVLAGMHIGGEGTATPTASSMVQAAPPSVAVAPPLKPKLPLLNGTYRIFHDWPNTTYRNNERKGGGTVHWDNSDQLVYKSFVFSTACAGGNCLATGQVIDDQGKLGTGDPFVMRLDGGTWKDIAPMHWTAPCTLVSTGQVMGEATQSERTDFVPQIDGTFHGTQTVTVETDGCGDRGDTAITQLTMTRIWG